jgi:hypothetical protein
MHGDEDEDTDDETPVTESTKTKEIKQKYESIKCNIDKTNARLKLNYLKM